MNLSVSSFALVASTLPMLVSSPPSELVEEGNPLQPCEWQQAFDATSTDFSVTPPTISDEALGAQRISVPVDLTWNATAKRRFQKLAVAEALGTLNAKEARELENLTVLRRHGENPRAPEEILWDYRQRQVTAQLVEALQRYVEFHRPTDHPQIAS